MQPGDDWVKRVERLNAIIDELKQRMAFIGAANRCQLILESGTGTFEEKVQSMRECFLEATGLDVLDGQSAGVTEVKQ